jgi:hypothetical protein
LFNVYNLKGEYDASSVLNVIPSFIVFVVTICNLMKKWLSWLGEMFDIVLCEKSKDMSVCLCVVLCTSITSISCDKIE